MKADKDPKDNNSERERERTHFQTKGKYAKEQLTKHYSKHDGHRIVRYGYGFGAYLQSSLN